MLTLYLYYLPFTFSFARLFLQLNSINTEQVSTAIHQLFPEWFRNDEDVSV